MRVIHAVRRAPGWLGALLAGLLTGSLYVGAARLVLLTYDPLSLGPGFWPSAGITMSALLLTRRSWWPTILLCVAAAEMTSNALSGFPVESSLVWATANVVEPAIGALVVRRLRAEHLRSVREVVVFVLAAAVLAPLVAGAIGATATLGGSGMDYLARASRWAIGDGLGVLTLTPAVVLLVRGPRTDRVALRRPTGLLTMLGVAVLSTIVYWLTPWAVTGPYLLVPPLLWAAIRYHTTGAAVAALLMSQIANTAATTAHGALSADASPVTAIIAVQAYLATITATLLVVGASSREGATARRAAARERRRADREDALGQLTRAVVDVDSAEELQTRARTILGPVLGGAEVELLLAETVHPLVDGGPQAREVDGALDPVAEDLLRSARRRMEVEHGLADVLDDLEVHAGLARLLLDSTGQGLYGMDLDGRCTFANRACAELLGYAHPHELVGRVMHDLVHHTRPDGTPYPRAECSVWTGLRDRSMSHVTDEVLFRRDGTSFPAEYRSHPVTQGEELVGVVVTFVDATAQRQAQRQVEESEARFRGLFTAANTGIALIGVDRRLTDANPEFCRMVGRARDQLVGRDVLGLIHPLDGAMFVGVVDQMRHGERSTFRGDARLATAEGTAMWVDATVARVADDDGGTVGMVATMQDMTELRKATDEARTLSVRLTATLESITDAFFTLDRGWRFTYVNGRAEGHFGAPRRQLLGRQVWDVFPDLVDTPLHEVLHDAMREGAPAVVDDTELPPLEGWFTANVYPSAQGVAVYLQDVTEHHLARRALRDHEARLAAQAPLLDAARDAIVVRDLDGWFSYWNPSAEELYGWTLEEVRDRPARSMFPDPTRYDAAMEVLLAEGVFRGELQFTHRDGSTVEVDSRWTLVRDAAGQPISVLVIDTDITERKRLESRLLRVQRLESLGTLAGGLAHDLNNVLSPITISTELLMIDEGDPKRLRLLEGIRSSTQRAADTVGHILSFARGVEGRREAVDVSSLLADLLQIVEDTFPKTIHIHRDIAPDLWPVIGDATQIHQVLLNLCLNARDAMPDGGVLRLVADTAVIDEQYAALSKDALQGHVVRVLVADTGTGMSPEVRDRMFDPFFTTKPQGRGTGLGLSISRGIIDSHGGFITVGSVVGEGTRFLVHLPAATTPMDVPPAAAGAPPHGCEELVLLIDDEAPVRRVIGQTLQTFGYRVIEAADGEAAIEVMAARAEEVDVVVSDIMMPGMGGPEAVEALRRIRPDVPVVAMSGLHVRDNVTAMTQMGAAHFLRKPCSIDDLLHTVRRAIVTRSDVPSVP